MMGTRFICAGAILGAFLIVRGGPRPTWRQVRNASMLGALMLVGGMGCTAIAEQTTSSGATTVMIATMPIFALLWQIPFGHRPRWFELVTVALGTIGVVILGSGADFNGNWHGFSALMVALASWSLGSVLSRKMDLPQGASAFALEMLAGGIVLIVASAVVGEPRPGLPTGAPLAAWFYLVVFGSLVAFSAHMYLTSRVSSTLATSYVYVNPPIALAIGAWLGGEHIVPQTLSGVAVILAALAVLSWGTMLQHRPQPT